MRAAIVSGIHPGKWIDPDRVYLEKTAGFAFTDERHSALLDAIHDFRLIQALPPAPPTSLVLSRLQRLEKNLDAAESLLRIKPAEIDDAESRSFRRSAANVNLYAWQFLVAAGAKSPSSITLQHVAEAHSNVRALASIQRPEGSSSSGRQEIPGLVLLVANLVDIRRSAGIKGAVSYWCHDNDSYRGYLHDFLPCVLRINDLLTHLEVFHGNAPPSQPIKVSAPDLETLPTSREARMSGSTIRSYYWRAKQIG